MSKFEKSTGLSISETVTFLIGLILWIVILFIGTLLSNQ